MIQLPKGMVTHTTKIVNVDIRHATQKPANFSKFSQRQAIGSDLIRSITCLRQVCYTGGLHYIGVASFAAMCLCVYIYIMNNDKDKYKIMYTYKAMFLIVRGLSASSGTLTESLDLIRSHMDSFVWVRVVLCDCISNFNRPSEHIIRSNQKARTHPPQKGKVSTPNHICYSDFMKQKRIRRNRYRLF